MNAPGVYQNIARMDTDRIDRYRYAVGGGRS